MPKNKDYVLNPRGKPLYEDSNRFGTKMLEKMGWSKGKGLGVQLDGDENFIRITHKANTFGLGYRDTNDQWTQHVMKFNEFLDSFKSKDKEDLNINKISSSEPLKFDSLEEKSSKSRARVHYKKFTRGKDISRYSEIDLANIFGKKSLNVQQNIDTSNEQNDENILNGSNLLRDEQYVDSSKQIKKKKHKNKSIIDGNLLETYVEQQSIENHETDDKNNNNIQIDSNKDFAVKKSRKRERSNEIDENGKDEDILSTSTIDSNRLENYNSTENFENDDNLKLKKRKSSKYRNLNVTNTLQESNESQELPLSSEVNNGSMKSRTKKRKHLKEGIDEILDNHSIDKGNSGEEVEMKRRTKKRKDIKEAIDEIIDNHSIDKVNSEEKVEMKIRTRKRKHLKEAVDEIIDNHSIDKVNSKEEVETKPFKPKDDVVKEKKLEKIKRKSKHEEPKSINDKTQEKASSESQITETQDNTSNSFLTTLLKSISTLDYEKLITEYTTRNEITLNLEQEKSIFEMTRYKAEILKFLNLMDFNESSLNNITGYGFGTNVELKINATKMDEERIGDLWDKALVNKYGKEVIAIKKKKKYSIKTLKRKNVFTSI